MRDRTRSISPRFNRFWHLQEQIRHAVSEDREALDRTLRSILTSVDDVTEIISLGPSVIGCFVNIIQRVCSIIVIRVIFLFSDRIYSQAMDGESYESPFHPNFAQILASLRSAADHPKLRLNFSELIQKSTDGPARRGALSDVYQGRWLGQERVALKVLRVMLLPNSQAQQVLDHTFL